jgi:hypothetical protein
VAKKSTKQNTNIYTVDNLNKNNGSVLRKITPYELTSIYIPPEDGPSVLRKITPYELTSIYIPPED